MAKVKKMADGGITGLGSLVAGAIDPGYGFNPTLGGGGGTAQDGTAQDGLGQINAGSATVGRAIGTAQSALGGGGGNGLIGGGGTSPNNDMTTQKKGGAVKKHLRVNQDNSKISTHKKNPKHKNSW